MGRRQDRMERREARFRARKDGIERPEGIGEEAVQRVLRVPPELAGMRLDRFLQGQLRATSRTRSQAIIDVCAFRPDGRPLKKNHRVQADERVILWRDPLDGDGAPETLTIVYEDEDILAVQKPPNVAVHPTARHHRATVSRILEDQLPDDRLTLIHRLDRETSGVLLLARTRAADRAVKIQFEERKNVDKRYLAIVWGHPPWDRQRCDLPLGPATDTIYRVKMGVVEGGLPSATSFEVLGRRWRGDRAYALVGCELHTGRQHQIRVHLRALGFPIVGDKLYGPDEAIFARGADDQLTEEDLARLELPRHALHALSLTIDHPRDGRRVTIEAPLAPDLAAFWKGLEERPSTDR